MSDAMMTPEEAAEAQVRLADYFAAQNEAKKAESRLKLQPLVDIGLGSDEPLSVTLDELASRMLELSPTMAALDPPLSRLLATLSEPLRTANERIKILVQQNAANPSD